MNREATRPATWWILAVGSLALGATTGCNRAPGPSNQTASVNQAAVAPAQNAALPSNQSSVNASGTEAAKAQQAGGAEHEDRSGPTRDAECEINDEGPVACSFTPVLGDGSFDIDTPDRELRVVVSQGEAAVFERIGARRIPIPGTLRRNPHDPACWFTDEPDMPISQVCAR